MFSQGLLFCEGIRRGVQRSCYLVERRRALMRARADAKNAPAEPTTARIAVGFSGESVQPPCAWRGRVTANKTAKPSNMRVDFFIDGLHLEGTGTKVFLSMNKVHFRSYHSGYGNRRTRVIRGKGMAASSRKSIRASIFPGSVKSTSQTRDRTHRMAARIKVIPRKNGFVGKTTANRTLRRVTFYVCR